MVFSIIEVGSKAFISGQGPANFGPYMTYAKNAIIKNGVIGRSSHHGIHANGVENLLKILNTLGEDTNTFIISHKGDILDGKFESKIEFVKDRNFSKMKI